MTSGVKVGQRVRVKIPDGSKVLFYRWSSESGRMNLELDCGVSIEVPAYRVGEFVEVLPEPLKIGDEINPRWDDEPPVGTVLLREDDGEAVRRETQGWAYASSEEDVFSWDDGRPDDLASGPWRVVWLPGNQT